MVSRNSYSEVKRNRRVKKLRDLLKKICGDSIFADYSRQFLFYLSPYALQKYAAEQYCLILGKRYNIPVVSFLDNIGSGQALGIKAKKELSWNPTLNIKKY